VVVGVDVLAGIGTDVALMHLHGIAQTARSASLKKKARERLDEVAAERELTPEQLADRIAPDFGLDADGSMTLDYGPRRFKVGFDERLKPYVTDEDGALRKILPRPSAKDDQELAPAAHKRFATLKKDVDRVAGDQIRRLERAMAEQRGWRVDEFRTFLMEHPLVWHIARRLVWTAETQEGAFSFRIAEDRTLADADDETVKLPDNASIAIAHPLLLGKEQVDAWSELFADYEILQPFPQLGRPVHTLSEQEANWRHLERYEGMETSPRRLLGLRNRSWDAEEIDGYMGLDRIARNVGSDHRIVVAFSPGFEPRYLDDVDHVEIRQVSLTGSEGDTSRTVRFADLGPVTISEILTDLEALRRA
ncbi:DUF4132 domain-containing protein, partial [Actinomadura adrarensis]